MRKQLFNKKIRKLLYYPSIEFPEDHWAKQALLFWDEIASIVPKTYDFELKESVPLIPLSQNMAFLFNEKVFCPINPADFFDINKDFEKLEEFTEDFFRILTDKPFQSSLDRLTKRVFSAKIHYDKLSSGIIDSLIDLGLAKEPDDYGDWYYFEIHTGLLYMSLLAKYLADVDPKHTVPGTNLKEYESLIFKTESLNQGLSCIDVRYHNALPIPKQSVSFQDILEFKNDKKNRLSLFRFRKLIDSLHHHLADVDNQNMIDEVLAGFKENLELGLSDLTEHLSESKIEYGMGCLKTILSLKSPTFWSSAGVIAGKATNIASLPLEWAIPGIALIGAVQIGQSLIHETNKTKAAMRRSDFAYLYHAQENGII